MSSGREGSQGPQSRLDTTSKTIEDDFNGRLRELLKQVGFADASARKFPVHGANKPDGAWTYVSPDQESRTAIFSGKMGTLRQMADAINTAAAYKRNLSRIEIVEEAFGVTFPENQREKFGLYALESRWHPFRSFVIESLDGVAERIREVLSQRETEPEPSEPMMLRLLQSVQQRLASTFVASSVKQLAQVLGADSPLLTSLVSIDEKSGEPITETRARNAAAYILVNQVLFYHILASHKNLHLSAIDPDKVLPQTLRTVYFGKVLEIDYKPVFEFDIAQHLSATDGKRALRSLVRAFEIVQASQIGNDVIGKVFHNLIPAERRKPLGAFYTNSNAGELLARLTVEKEFDRVLDPACGSGTLLVSAYNAKADLFRQRNRTVDQRVHERFVSEQITGIDIMIFSAHLAVVNLSLRAPEYRLEKVRVAIMDSLQLRPGDVVESSRAVLQRASRFGFRRLDAYAEPEKLTQEGGVSGGFPLSSVDVVLMNPPFSDSDRIPVSYKRDLGSRFDAGRTAGLLQGKYSLQLPFLLQADNFLKDGGRIGAVLPVTTFTGEAFSGWVDFLAKNYTVRAIIVGLGKTWFSENTQLSECLLVAEKTPPHKGSRFVLMGVETSPHDWDSAYIRRVSEVIRAQKAEIVPGSFISRVLDQSLLPQSAGGLQAQIQHMLPEWTGLSEVIESLLTKGTIPFSQLASAIGLRFELDAFGTKEQSGPQGRGKDFYCFDAIAYYTNPAHATVRKNDRLCVTADDGVSITVQDKQTGVTFSVQKSKLVPLARRVVGRVRLDASDDLDWIVASRFDGLAKIVEHIVATSPKLNKAGVLSNPTEVYLARIRERWPKRVNGGRARLWLARKVDVGGSGTNLIAQYSERRPMVGPAMWMMEASDQFAWVERGLALWLNSTIFLYQVLSFRKETRGSWGEIDKRKMLPSRVPEFLSLSASQREAIELTFAGVKKEPFPSVRKQLESNFASRTQIDNLFVKLLRPTASDEDVSQIVKRLQSVVGQRIAQMKKGM